MTESTSLKTGVFLQHSLNAAKYAANMMLQECVRSVTGSEQHWSPQQCRLRKEILLSQNLTLSLTPGWPDVVLASRFFS